MPDFARLDAARRELGFTIYDLWLDYMALGGHRDAFAVQAYLTGRGAFADSDHDHLVHALNEAFAATGANHPLAYRCA